MAELLWLCVFSSGETLIWSVVSSCGYSESFLDIILFSILHILQI